MDHLSFSSSFPKCTSPLFFVFLLPSNSCWQLNSDGAALIWPSLIDHYTGSRSPVDRRTCQTREPVGRHDLSPPSLPQFGRDEGATRRSQQTGRPVGQPVRPPTCQSLQASYNGSSDQTPNVILTSATRPSILLVAVLTPTDPARPAAAAARRCRRRRHGEALGFVRGVAVG